MKRKKVTNPLEHTSKQLQAKKDENKEYDIFQKSCSCMMLELYPDDINYNYQDVISHLVSFADNHDLFYAYITHNKDVYDKSTYTSDYRLLGKKGDLKKPHTHFVLCAGSSPLIVSDVFLGVTFPSRFIKLIKPKDIENVVLYLSHIKYVNKAQYNVSDIVTNRPDYVQLLHDEYVPSSAVNFVIQYLETCPHIVRFSDMWDVALNKSDIPYSDYYKNYNLIKDIIREHNEDMKIQINRENIVYDIENKARIKSESEINKLFNLASTFGTTGIDKDGFHYQLTCTGEIKKR